MHSRKPSRLVVVSNRVGPATDAARAGGLAVALVEAMRRRGGLWFGWSGEVSESTLSQAVLKHHGRLSLATVHLSREDYDEYYRGFANTSLWPLFHYRLDLTEFDRGHYKGYLRVNRRFARVLQRLLQPDDLLWVHDYHLLAFAEELRRMGCRQRMGFFLHIPFPPPEVVATLPVHDMLMRALFAYDVVGLQTETDRRCFVRYVVDEAGGIDNGDGTVTAYGRTVRAEAFPISIDTDGFAAMVRAKDAQSHLQRMRRQIEDRVQIVGVDRLDYTKGLPERFRAFRQLLESYPENRGGVSFLQIAPKSRADVSQYQDIREELEGLAGSINGEFARYDWTPIRYLNQGFSRRALAGIYRASRVGLVTPLRDGMNLVAKEYVAAQSPRNPGVLVLSRFAGAATQLTEALIVNPYDQQGVADALQRAINMPEAERRERWRALMRRLRVEDVGAWAKSFLERLQCTPTERCTTPSSDRRSTRRPERPPAPGRTRARRTATGRAERG
jgi:trehalose 6-phosphate synthase